MPTVVGVKVFSMCIIDANEFSLLLSTIVTVLCQTEISFFGKFIRVLFFGV